MPAPRILLSALLAGAAPAGVPPAALAALAAYHKADYEQRGQVIATAKIRPN